MTRPDAPAPIEPQWHAVVATEGLWECEGPQCPFLAEPDDLGAVVSHAVAHQEPE